MHGTPILRLSGEQITSLFYDGDRGIALVGLNSGRILKVSALASTAYSAGSRRLYVQARDSFGNLSGVASTSITYALWKAVLHVASTKAEITSKSVDAWGAFKGEVVSATFTTPALFAGKDFERWHSVAWEQVIGGGEVTVSVRTATTSAGLLSADWRVFREAASGSFLETLDDICQNGPYVQAKVEMRTSSSSPSVGSLGIAYGAKHASYFFTTKLILERGSNASSGLLTASATVPANTEVIYGVASSNTTDWEDYQVIEADKLFSMPAADRIKIGIKMVSYDASSAPEVDEFAIEVGAEKDNLFNRVSSSS